MNEAAARIRVAVRLRPAAGTGVVHVDAAARTLTVPSARGAAAAGEGRALCDHTADGLRFSIDAIYDARATQRDVFDAEGAPLVAHALAGSHATLLAYGQTGAGKTHTVLGRGGGTSAGAFDDRGLVPRAVERVFELARLRQRGGASVDVGLSCMEVYNETLIDLLAAADAGAPARRGARSGGPSFNDGGAAFGAAAAPPPLAVWERAGGVEVRGLVVSPARSADEALRLLYDAEMNRAVASHAMNAASSRSHLVVTAHVCVREARAADDAADDGEEAVQRTKLHLVDLAGSERTKATASRDATATAREAGYINKSLSFLEHVVVALGERHRDHVPFRSSKLTHVLRDALGGDCRTTLLACLWPDAHQLDQTLATLRFAARMGRIECAPVHSSAHAHDRAKAARHHGTVNAKLRREVDALRAELAVHDVIARRPAPDYAYGALTSPQRRRARDAAAAYVADGEQTPPVVTTAQIHAVYAALREMAVGAPSDAAGEMGADHSAASREAYSEAEAPAFTVAFPEGRRRGSEDASNDDADEARRSAPLTAENVLEHSTQHFAGGGGAAEGAFERWRERNAAANAEAERTTAPLEAVPLRGATLATPGSRAPQSGDERLACVTPDA
ncbi:P-loop containing nucleoside triphosphate hydrolase protein [Pelagophyceae sp. CCMP2097]|nr:P-loop containing nucleoside triphosphate hydrolase protein [Pelagophyceae sp. CCMP2097]